MIDLTPLDVRNKRGDFRKGMRGYDVQEVDVFLELVAERLEALVRENLQLKERVQSLQQQVNSQTGREQAVQEALVTAQELRAETQAQAQKKAELIVAEAETEARRRTAEADADVRRTLRDAERKLEQAQDALRELERRRVRFLKSFKQLLADELGAVEMEENRPPLDQRPVSVDLGIAPERPPQAPSEPPPLPREATAGGGTEEPGSSEQEVTGEDEDVEVSMDAPVDELAALYETQPEAGEEEAESPEGEPREEELFLSLEDESKSGG